MRKEWSKDWKSSSQPRKQRKYRVNAPLHVKRRLTRCHLSKDLRKKYQKRGFSPVKGDTVRVMRGNFKSRSGKVEIVDVKSGIIKVAGIEVSRKDGNKSLVSLQPSNLMITSLNLQDKARAARLENKKSKEKAVKEKNAGTQPKTKEKVEKVHERKEKKEEKKKAEKGEKNQNQEEKKFKKESKEKVDKK